MPASPTTEHLTLANGLNVVLCHAPRLKRCAASLRVAAGSHDVSAAWPGLAHFLEHLFFLGTDRFAGDEKLMAFVQRHGGQINASTRERTTDFFFELPLTAFAQGLERLCDMLAHPRMTMADQLREREVLHAEFIAWSRDVTARQHMQMLEGISARHPLRAFHAGNRYSLPVPRPAFQQALQDFYQRFYQAGQMTLCLAGPQSLEELKQLATNYGAGLASGVKVAQATPPKLVDDGDRILVRADQQLLLACEDLPDGADEAAAFLCHCLNGSRAQGVVEALKAEVVYQFAGQILIKVDVSVVSETDIAGKRAPTGEYVASVGARLPAMASVLTQNLKTQWPTLRDDYNRLQQRQLDVSSALELSHHHARNLPQGLSEQGGKALIALLGQIQPNTQPSEIRWQFPKPNPFLTVPSNGHEGALYLRWRLPSPQPTLWRMYEQSLKPLARDAKQAGVNLEFSAYGHYWQLKLSGLDAPMPEILKHALQRLSAPDDASLGQPGDEPALIPIRQLLKALPDCYLNAAPASETAEVQAFWPATQWISFTSGFAKETIPTLNSVLRSTPGQRDEQTLQAPALAAGKHWQSAAPQSSESAVLLFCPTPSSSIADEAAWRLLAHLAQSPFYQRLRVELQLGYAVFSGLRQIAGRTGILFGVQSPNASVPQLVEHIEQFLNDLPDWINDAELTAQTEALVAQLDLDAMETAQAAELRWQVYLAGRDERFVSALHETLRNLDRQTVLQAAASLRQATGGWLYLTNSQQTPWRGA
ncbi:pyrroloquinoline quinone biosynthesis protein PqqF [Pseudomonas syringae group sp. J309-1]|uniref:pyrroloquinoline quinone biosynthesis protein PqqF n=1 Tax=Pseudomonas syringae group sp. J309-1 TaxID=3079588 RepID=UPI0029138FA7|nr:pyrroloquinoline quinone biosynthesis protein PqqF [Pseudomonas syringae group sp. J309-1]MDU8358589.1 pyrroloquinoline quinone biosynthesis protein PqqF [Pseudomonas syringae group sp. J309-1]